MPDNGDGMFNTISRDDLKSGLADGSLLLIDVREPHEFAAGHIPGAVSMPLSTFDPADLPETDQTIIFACAAGVRSVHAMMATRMGPVFVDTHYAGGFKDWVEAGEEIAR